MIQFERVSLTDLIVIISLSLGFIMATYTGEKEIAGTLGGGLLGYARGTVKNNSMNSMNKREELKNGK